MVLNVQWEVERTMYADGDENIIRRYFYVKRRWPMKLHAWRYRYDGLPVRQIAIGPVEFGWGENHEWICPE